MVVEIEDEIHVSCWAFKVGGDQAVRVRSDCRRSHTESDFGRRNELSSILLISSTENLT